MPNPVLILGAGINGAALARELALNGVDVVLVDIHDIAAGATSYSSRLIHGGLRYLEYGDFALVRESLGERTRLLRLAPQFVRPLRLFIPVQNRFGGFISAARKFLGLKGRLHSGNAQHRGLWTVRFGLWLYDRYARDPTLPKHKTHRANSPAVVPVDQATFGWVCSFSDAQVVFPERFTLALLNDARNIAAQAATKFRVLTYHEATLADHTATIRRKDSLQIVEQFQPSAIVNATGAWVDHTLQSLKVPSKLLMGGTKGSHFVTGNPRLQQLLGGRAVYTEAGDGRPIFILPFDLPFLNGTLVGTTDEPFQGDPATAIATQPELEYLVAAVNEVFPQVHLSLDDIDLHYAGIRPLPFSDASTPGAISRRHWMEPNPNCEVPLYSIIGGKLTTCRSLAEEAAGEILKRLGMSHLANSSERPIVESEPLFAVRRPGDVSGSNRPPENNIPLLHGTQIPLDVVRKVIREEWVTTLDDLVERRLMLLYHPQLSRECLNQLADLLIEAELLTVAEKADVGARIAERLLSHFGKRVLP
ncbi:MAG TPA: glycerol-3-phosphate dehydrogenase/oxidase [Pirellulales bacterium]|jgi:glycerol-3-phosphate dehydrogenase|nr:glycerol-3-phosphate dehydrogenase/oxidase [Pirellulales bacterium]